METTVFIFVFRAILPNFLFKHHYSCVIIGSAQFWKLQFPFSCSERFCLIRVQQASLFLHDNWFSTILETTVSIFVFRAILPTFLFSKHHYFCVIIGSARFLKLQFPFSCFIEKHSTLQNHLPKPVPAQFFHLHELVPLLTHDE